MPMMGPISGRGEHGGDDLTIAGDVGTVVVEGFSPIALLGEETFLIVDLDAMCTGAVAGGHTTRVDTRLFFQILVIEEGGILVVGLAGATEQIEVGHDQTTGEDHHLGGHGDGAIVEGTIAGGAI